MDYPYHLQYVLLRNAYLWYNPIEVISLKLMSFNTQHCLNYIRQEIDYPIMADAILKCEADIVGLNEMRNLGSDKGYDKQAEILSDLTGLKHHYFAEAIRFDDRNPYGNALISRFPIVKAETIPVPDPNPRTGVEYYETRCLLKAKLENGLTLLVIHFGLNRDEQENAVQTVVENLEPEKCILMGDFNVKPDNPLLEPIRSRMKDTAEAFTSPLLSFPSDGPTRKIDYIFVSPDVEILSASIPPIVASDHRPHTAEIRY